MRLINVHSLKLEQFTGADHDIPPYAILSHTWGADELTLQRFDSEPVRSQFRAKTPPQTQGHEKIASCCFLAAAAGLDYVWVDTVCIDRSSSAELTEAINSMFRWYQNAALCHVWLFDLDAGGTAGGSTGDVKECRWFTRGWTLQELLAPKRLEFYDAAWTFRGTKKDLQADICAATRISADVLDDPARMYRLPVAQRMSWAASRKTTRPEDTAYCLLGIFDVSMPMLYGEGTKAFSRLQEEIAKSTNDLSLFAWRNEPDDEKGTGDGKQRFNGVLATSPACFRESFDVVAKQDWALSPEYTMTNKGVRIEASLAELHDGRVLLFLNVLSRATRKEMGIWVRAHGGGLYSRVGKGLIVGVIPGTTSIYTRRRRVYLVKHISPAHAEELASGHRGAVMLRDNFNRWGLGRDERPFPAFPFEAVRVRPEDEWLAAHNMVLTHGAAEFFVFVWLRLRQDLEPSVDVLGEGMLVLVVGKIETETEPFVMVLGTALAGRVLRDPGAVDKWLLLNSRTAAGSATLPLFKTEGGLTVSAALEKVTVEGEVVHAVDVSCHQYRKPAVEKKSKWF